MMAESAATETGAKLQDCNPEPTTTTTTITTTTTTENVAVEKEKWTEESGTTLPTPKLIEFIPDQIWTKLYYFRRAGGTFSARTTIVKLHNGQLLIHSPGGPLDQEYKAEISELGPVGFIVAPGDWHHLHVPEWQLAYPDAKTYICPGLDAKRKDLPFQGILTDTPEEHWKEDFEQAVIVGRWMSEVLFFHRSSKTLIVTDLVHFMTETQSEVDGTKNDWGAWFWTNVLRMKNRPVLAPEYRIFGFPDVSAVKVKLDHVIVQWKPERVALAHGECMAQGAEAIEQMLRSCWNAVLVV